MKHLDFAIWMVGYQAVTVAWFWLYHTEQRFKTDNERFGSAWIATVVWCAVGYIIWNG